MNKKVLKKLTAIVLAIALVMGMVPGMLQKADAVVDKSYECVKDGELKVKLNDIFNTPIDINSHGLGFEYAYSLNPGLCIKDYSQLVENNGAYSYDIYDPATSTNMIDILFRTSQIGKFTFKINLYDMDTNTLLESKTVEFNINAEPTITSATTASYEENGTGTVYTAAATDTDGDTITWNISGTDEILFNMTTSGALTFKTPPNYEAPADSGNNNEYNLYIVASDGNYTTSQALTVIVTNVNEAPTDISLSKNFITASDTGIDSVIGNFGSTDTDAGDTFAYTLVAGTGSTDNGIFNILGNSLRNTSSLAVGNYSVLVRTTDNGGLYFEKAFTITVTPAAPTVTNISPSSGSTAGGTTVTITGTDFTGATEVTIDGTYATNFTVNNDTSITATVPVGTAGAKNVVVTTTSGSGTGTGLFTYINPPPTVNSATYDAGTGILVVTCSNMTTGNIINTSKLTLTGEGGSTYTLTTENVTAINATTFSVALNASDKAAVNMILNKNDTSSTSGTTFNLAAMDDWNINVTAGDTFDTTNPITVSNVSIPTITSATYNSATGVLVVTGTSFLSCGGANNDIDVSKLTISGDSTDYTLAHTYDVELNSATQFAVTLSSADKAAAEERINKNGTSSLGSVTYNLAAAEDWAAGADVSVVVADMTGNDITASNVVVSPIVTTTEGATSFTEGNNVTSTPVAVDSGMTLSDADNATLTSATIAITGNFQSGQDVLSFTSNSSTMGDITGSYIAGTGVLTLTSPSATATVASWQSALRSVTYTNNSDIPNTLTRVISFIVNDGTSDSNVATKSVSTTSINDAPTITVPGGISVTEDVASALTGISFGDVDAGSGAVSATVSVGSGILSANAGSGTTVAGSSTGTLTLNGSVGDINAFVAANNVTFTTAENSTGNVVLTVSINDLGNTGSGGALNTVDTVTLIVVEVNDAPTITAPDSIAVTEGVATALTGISFDDVDVGSNILRAAFIVKNGTLTAVDYSSFGIFMLIGDSTGSQVLVIEGTLANINAYIAASKISFTSAADAIADEVMEISTSDLGSSGSGGSQTALKTVILSIPATINVVTTTNGTLNIVLDKVPTVAPVAADFTATSKIDSGVASSLPLSNFVWNAATKTVTFNFTAIAEVAASQSVVVAVSYNNGTGIEAPAFIVDALAPTIATVSSVTTTNGTLNIVLDKVPTVAPVAADFTATSKIDSGVASSLPLSNFVWNAATKTVTFNFTAIAEVAASQSVVVAVSYKGETAINAAPYTVEAITAGGGSNNDYTPTPQPINNNFPIIINGEKQEPAGTATEGKQGNQTKTTVTLDEKKLDAILEKIAAPISGEEKPVITVPVSGNSDIVTSELNGQIIKDMENKEVVLEIKTETATYSLPAQQINIDEISEQIGKAIELKDIKVQIEIAKSTAETVKVVESAAKKGEFTIVASPVDFTVTCTYGNKTIDVSSFNAYVERTVAIPEGIDPSKITTGIVVDPDGTVRHIPTKIVLINGRYFAKINSLTNSTYSVVWHPVEFKDVNEHWAKDAINDMGSRLVISGVGNDLFAPDKDITRAEFAAIIVNALGLKPGLGSNPFSDVKNTDWYCEYIQTAYEYGIIAGVGKGKFGPMDKITHEQAMTMIAKAMKITGLKVDFKTGEAKKLISAFGDLEKSSVWAKDSIATCVTAGILPSNMTKVLAPKVNITRAEVADIVRKLLQKSNLI